MIIFIGIWVILSGIGVIGFVTQYPESVMTWLGIIFGIFIIIGGILVLHDHEQNEKTTKDYSSLRANFNELKDEVDVLSLIFEVITEMTYSDLVKLKNALIRRDTEILDTETFRHTHILFEIAIDKIDDIIAAKGTE